jgi:hypothetical protein
MHLIEHQMSLLHPDFPLLRQTAERRPQFPPDSLIQNLPPTLRYEHRMIFAFPRRVLQTFICLHGLLLS